MLETHQLHRTSNGFPSPSLPLLPTPSSPLLTFRKHHIGRTQPPPTQPSFHKITQYPSHHSRPPLPSLLSVNPSPFRQPSPHPNTATPTPATSPKTKNKSTKEKKKNPPTAPALHIPSPQAAQKTKKEKRRKKTKTTSLTHSLTSSFVGGKKGGSECGIIRFDLQRVHEMK